MQCYTPMAKWLGHSNLSLLKSSETSRNDLCTVFIRLSSLVQEIEKSGKSKPEPSEWGKMVQALEMCDDIGNHFAGETRCNCYFVYITTVPELPFVCSSFFISLQRAICRCRLLREHNDWFYSHNLIGLNAKPKSLVHGRPDLNDGYLKVQLVLIELCKLCVAAEAARHYENNQVIEKALPAPAIR